MADERAIDTRQRRTEGVFGNLPGPTAGNAQPAPPRGATTRQLRPSPASRAPERAPSLRRHRLLRRRNRRPHPAAEATPPAAPEPATGQRISSVEDLAWAGIAVAAQAATVGVRFASRALEAARKSVDRPDSS